MARIVVLGYIVRGPLGGLAWHHLQYVDGLARLGHDVWFLEQSDNYDSCYDPRFDSLGSDASYGLAFAADAFDRVGLGDHWAYCDSQRGWLGPAAGVASAVMRSADVVLNVSGVNELRDDAQGVPIRVLIDTDPAFTQIRHLTDPTARELAARHNRFFSFAESIRLNECTIPDDHFAWQATRQPIVLARWTHHRGRPDGAFTTVMQWDSYRAREFGDCHFGMKSESMEPYLALPASSNERFELALGSASAPRERLRALGWSIIDSRTPTVDPCRYQRYIAESKAEFSVAKHGYVAASTGWFSERSAAYLASGRPVLVQDTGFSRHLPTGQGLLPFSCFDEAVNGVEQISIGYDAHCAAARELAAACFDSDVVLTRVLDQATPSSCSP